MSTLGYAILGLLADRPRTGYEVARAMEAPIGYLWSARHSQIYPELATLEADRLVRPQIIDGPGPRDTKRYSLTTKGRSALATWVDSPLPVQPARSELMLRMRCLWLISPARAREFLSDARRNHEQRLIIYREEEHAFLDNPEGIDDPLSPRFGAYMTLTCGISYELHMLSWFDTVLSRLDSSLADQALPMARD
jgi:DNA-binding PadR family transcriptional regulator